MTKFYTLKSSLFTSIAAFCLLFVSLGASAQVPANDACSGATTIVVDDPCAAGNNLNATFTGEPSPSCWATPANNTIWFKFTTTQAGSYIISSYTQDDAAAAGTIQNPLFDTHLALYEGTCSALVPVSCNDDAAGFRAVITADLPAGVTYYIQYDNTAAGQAACISVKLSPAPVPEVPTAGPVGSNDSCKNATVLVVNDPCVTGNNSSYGSEPGEPFGSCYSVEFSNPVKSAWYKFTTDSAAATYVINTVGVMPTTDMAIYTGSCGAFTEVECFSDGNTQARIVTSNLLPNTEYYVQYTSNLSFFLDEEYTYCISVTSTPVVSPPPLPLPVLIDNDTCGGAFTIVVNAPCVVGEENGTNVGATFSNNAQDPNPGCFGVSTTGLPPTGTVWYKFNSSSAGSYIVTTEGSENVDMQVALWKGTCGNLTLMQCSETGIPERFSATLEENTTYYLQANQYGNTQGPFCLQVLTDFVQTDPSDTIPVVNDCITNAIDITNQLNGGVVKRSATDSTTYTALGGVNPFNCGIYRYTNSGDNSTKGSEVANDRTSRCDDTIRTNIQDIWFKFTIPAGGVKAWIDAYEITRSSGVRADFRAALYSGAPTANCVTGAVSGLTYIDCSAGVTAATGAKRGGDKDMTACSTGFPRLDLNGLTAGTYYYRIWTKTAPAAEDNNPLPIGGDISISGLPIGTVGFTTDSNSFIVFSDAIDLSLCVESTEPDLISKDNCSTISAPSLVSPNCNATSTLPNFNSTSVVYTNVSNTGKFGKRRVTPVCNATEPNYITTIAKGEAAGGAGAFAPATIAAGDTDSSFYSNTAVYRFDVLACPSNNGLATLKFDQLKFGGLNGKGIRVQVIQGQDSCVSTQAANVVMYGTSAAADTCYQIRAKLPTGAYYVIVEGEGGQLAKYNLSIDLKYDIDGQLASSRPTATHAAKTPKAKYCTNEDIIIKHTGNPGFGIGNPTTCSAPTFKWVITNGTNVTGVDTRDSIVVRRTSPGTITAKLIVTNAGCASEEVTTTYIVDQPKSDFTLPAKVCQNSVAIVSFVGTDPETDVRYTWDFGAAASPASATKFGPDHNLIWATSGIKTVTLTALDTVLGCSSLTTKNIEVQSKPIASFTVTQKTVCINAIDTLTWNGTVKTNLRFQWNYNGANETPLLAVDSVGPHYVYWATAGEKNINLTVTDTVTQCSASALPIKVTVNAGGKPNIQFSKAGSACIGEKILVFDKDSSLNVGATYTWNFGANAAPVTGNKASTLVSWTSDGSKQITVSRSGAGCAAVDTQFYTINPKPSATITAPASACYDQVSGTITGAAIAPSVLTQYTWTLQGGGVQSGTGASIQGTWKTPGVDTIKLNVTDDRGCISDTIRKPITIAPRISIGITATQPTTCNGTNGTLTAAATPAGTYDYAWSTGETTAMIQNLSAGSYTVTATRQGDGCIADSTVALSDAGAGVLSELSRVDVSCNGGSDGFDSIKVVGGMPNYTYSLYDNANTLLFTADTSATNFAVSGFSAGKYTWEIVDAAGCKSNLSFEIKEPAALSVDLGSDKTVCGGTVTLTPAVSGGTGNYTYLWNTVPAQTTASIVVAPTATTTYIVTVTDKNDCVKQDDIRLNYNSTLSAAFDLSLDSICSDNTVDITFTGMPPNAGTEVYNWDFDANSTIVAGGSGSGIGKTGPYKVAYSAGGAKVISLQVSDAQCLTKQTKTLEVTNTPDATFTSSPTVCDGAKLQVTFAGIASSTAKFEWSYGDDNDGIASGTSSDAKRDVVWNLNNTTPVTKTITLKLIDGKCDTAIFTKTITVNPSPSFNFSTPKNGVCVNAQAPIAVVGTFVNPIYVWNFDADKGAQPSSATPTASNSANDNVRWDKSGNFKITLTVTDKGCARIADTFINVHPLPIATFTSTNQVCLGDTATVNYTGSESSTAGYDWHFNGGTPSTSATQTPKGPKWTTAGTYLLTLNVTSAFGCVSDSQKNTIKVLALPSNDFVLSGSTCEGRDTLVEAAYKNDDLAAYKWVFDPTASQFSDPNDPVQNVSWTGVGTKTVKLMVTDSNQCKSAELSKSITINSTPIADYTVSSKRCKNGDITLTFTGKASGAANFDWKLDGATLVSGNPTTRGPLVVRWNTIGNKTISLAINDGGCTTSQPLQKTITISDAPSSNFTVDKESICFNDTVSVVYTGNTAGPDNEASFEWSFGTDHKIITKKNNAEEYDLAWTTGGLKYISLKVTNQAGCASLTTLDSVTVAPEIKLITSAPVDATGPCGSATGSAKVDVLPAGDYTYSWNTTPVQTTQRALNIPAGIYVVTVTTEDGKCSAQKTVTVSDKDAPNAVIRKQKDVSCNGANDGYAIALASGGPNSSYNYVWNDPVATPTDSVGGLAAGTYVCQIYSTGSSCNRYIAVEIKEPSKLFVNAGSDKSICSGKSVTLSGEGSGGTLAYKSFLWSTGANTAAITVAPTARTGYEFTVTDANGCQSSDSVYVNVIQTPVARFSTSAQSNLACIGDDVVLTFNGTAGPGAIFDWGNFAGGSVSSGTGAGPYSVKWFSAGAKTVNLVVNVGSCFSDTGKQTITINRKYSAAFSPITTACVGAPVTYEYKGDAPANAQFVWDFGADVKHITGTGRESTPQTVSWTTSGTRAVKLTITVDGCTFSSTVNITVSDIPTSSFTIPGAICQNNPTLIDYTGNAPASADYLWSLDGGIGVSSSSDAVYFPDTLVTWNTPGTKTLKLTVSLNGCKSSETVQQTIVQKSPSVAFTIGGSGTSFCVKQEVTVTYDGTPSSTVKYNWNFGPGSQVLSGVDAGPYDVRWITGGFKDIVLTATEAGSSCSNSNKSTIFINPPVLVAVTPTAPSTCGGANGQLKVDFSNGIPNYDFEASGINGSPTPTPSNGSVASTQTFTGLSAGAYRILVQDVTASCPTDTVITLSNNNAPAFTAVITNKVNETKPNAKNGIVRILPDPAAVGPYTVNVYNVDGDIVGTGTSASGTDTVTVSGLAPGDYYYEVQRSAAPAPKCAVYGSFEIERAIPLLLTAAPKDLRICAGSDASIQAIVTGGTAPIQYGFDINDGNGILYQTTDTKVISQPTSSVPVDVFAMDNVGNTAGPYHVDITVNPTPLADININGTITTADDRVCFGQTATVAYAGPSIKGLGFQWNFGNGYKVVSQTGQTYTVKWDVPGTKSITLKVTDSITGCESSALAKSVEVEDVPTPSFSASNTKLCSGDSLSFTYTGIAPVNSTFIWSFPNGTPSTSDQENPGKVTWINNSASVQNNTVTLKVITPSGCSSTSIGKQVIAVNTLPNSGLILPNPAIICAANTATIKIASPQAGVNYVPNFGGGTQISGPAAGPYVVKFPAGTAVYTISVTATKAGCSTTSQQTLQVKAAPTAPFGVPAAAVCANDTVKVRYNPSGGIDPTYKYVWNFRDALIVSGNKSGTGPGEFGLKWPTSGNHKVDLTVVDTVLGCSSPVNSQTVKSLTKPSAPIPNPVRFCQNQVVLNPLTASASANGTLRWYGLDPNGPSSPRAPDPNTSTPGKFSYFVSQLVTTGGITCESDKIAVVVTVDSLDDARFAYDGGKIVNGITTICTNSPNPLVVDYYGFKVGTFKSSLSLGLNKNTGEITPSASKASGTPYTIKYTTKGKCPNTDSTQVVVNSPPQSSFIYDSGDKGQRYEYCTTDPVDPQVIYLNNTPAGGEFAYEPTILGNKLSVDKITGTIDVGASDPGEYKVSYLISDSSNDCGPQPSPVIVKIKLTPTADYVAKPDSSACEGDPVIFDFNPVNGINPSPQSTYTWSFSDTIVKGRTVNGHGPIRAWGTPGVKNISLIVNDAGCADTLNRTYSIEVKPNSNFVTDKNILPHVVDIHQEKDANVIFTPVSTAYGDDSYSWNFGDGNIGKGQGPIEHQYTKAGKYRPFLTVTVGQCKVKSDTNVLIVFTDNGPHDYVPNAFSPNGDGESDILRFKTVGLSEATIEIYNRWGQLIYTGIETDAGWDGSFKNETLSEGVYVYVIRGRTYDNKIYTSQPNIITLVR